MTDLDRILIADDDHTLLHSTADLLRREGYECACAPDAATAAEMLRSANYDLLITNLRMPGNSQLELVRNLPRIVKGMPVILVTGYPSLSSAIQSIQLPVAAYLVKPVDFDHLLVQVKISIENFRVYRAVRSIQQRLQDWRKDLAAIEEALTCTAGDVSFAAVDAFLDLTFRNIVGALLDMKYLTEAFAMHSVEQAACHLLNCPRLTALTDALLETVGILEETKNAFKSRELGELRRKLKSIVRSGEM